MRGIAQIILVRSDGALLLQLRDNRPGIKNPGAITAFGGRMEPGETPIQAACREMREETNLDLSEDDLTFFGFYQKNVADHGEDGDVYYFIIHDVDDRDLQIYEGQGFAIIRNEQEAASIKTSPLFREVLKDYYRQKA